MRITVPPSKSISHRAIICSVLADSFAMVKNLGSSDDINATMFGIRALMDQFKRIDITPVFIDCKDSASTLRFLIPLACTLGFPITFTGSPLLGERPLTPYLDMFEKHHIRYDLKKSDDKFSLAVSGRLAPGTYEMPGHISSQFISGLLFALPFLQGKSRIVCSELLESRGYVHLTMDMLRHHGVITREHSDGSFEVPGNQHYIPASTFVEGDYSQSAFWIVAGLISMLGSSLYLDGLFPHSMQPDAAILDIAAKMGGDLRFVGGSLKINPCETFGLEIDVSLCPDLTPPLAALAAVSTGKTKLTNCKRLIYKESNMLSTLISQFSILGAQIESQGDCLIIKGKKMLDGGIVNTQNDHRIAMALAVLSTRCTHPVTIEGKECVSKSYPQFFEDFKPLGGNIL